MTEQEIREIEEREKAATPGPWEATKADGFCDSYICPYKKQQEGKDCTECEYWKWAEGAFIDSTLTIDCGEGYGMNDADATFCAYAREDVPRLLDEVKRLQSELHRIDAVKRCYQNEYEKLQARLDKQAERTKKARQQRDALKMELDAAKQDLQQAGWGNNCEVCLHNSEGANPLACQLCNGSPGQSGFEWRGPCAENGGKDE